jgi:hypothetical protein
MYLLEMNRYQMLTFNLFDLLISVSLYRSHSSFLDLINGHFLGFLGHNNAIQATQAYFRNSGHTTTAYPIQATRHDNAIQAT